MRKFYSVFQKSETVSHLLSWSHYFEILKLDDPLEATDDYHILDATGRLIYSGNATTLTLPRGIYLITMGGEVEKIVL